MKMVRLLYGNWWFVILDPKTGDKIDAGIKSEGEDETGNNASKGKATLGRTPNHLTLR